MDQPQRIDIHKQTSDMIYKKVQAKFIFTHNDSWLVLCLRHLPKQRQPMQNADNQTQRQRSSATESTVLRLGEPQKRKHAKYYLRRKNHSIFITQNEKKTNKIHRICFQEK